MADSGLSEQVYGLSSEAFELARAAAESGDFSAGEARAQEISDQLTDLWPQVENAPPEEQASLSRAWTDARLDVGYVLSGGELSTSTRLHHVLQDLEQS